MSHHDIESLTEFTVTCRDCDFESYSTSPGVAEEIAENHIEKYIEGTGEPHYSHRVEIRELRLVGRNL